MGRDELLVGTTAGIVRGTLGSGVASFKGMPFAHLSVRFGEPGPALSWTGVRDGSSFGPPPPQSGMFGGGVAIRPDAQWLSLNVWTPDPSARLPVLVWIQGGGYMVGTSGLPEYDGTSLARTGSVVVVTFNYRVGVEGFAHIEGQSFNRGLLDQVAALEWVRENIEAFGGDRERVTVFGQSAGGGCVAALIAMPRAHGLFRRAIVQSMPGTFFTPELGADITATFASAMGLRPGELATVAPGDLAAAAEAFLGQMSQHVDRWGPVARRRIPFGPVVDGETLPTDPWQALADGAARDIDLIAGHTRHEQRLLSLIDGNLGQVTAEEAETTVSIFAPDQAGVRRYRGITDGPDELYELVLSDWLFRMPSLHLAEAHMGRTFLYELTWPAPGMGGSLGACHGLDVPLVFGNLTDNQPAMLLVDDVAGAENLSAQMRQAWTSFASNGDPGWPQYEQRERYTRVFDSEPAIQPYPEQVSREIWADTAFTPLPLVLA